MKPDMPIAVIGMTCRFPDAPSVKAFRENLLFGHDSIHPLTPEEIEREGIDPSLLEDDDFINAGTLIENVANFDYGFFSLSPKEASLMDPQHRLFLAECRKLLDVSNLTRDEDNIGIFAGCRQSTYQAFLSPIRPEQITESESFQQLMGNDKDYLATRASYFLNLNGPALTVQSACSTSLVAVHQACQSLRSGECDSAFAGGVAISFPQGVGYRASEGMIFSNDGKCRPFSEEGTGIVAGNGLGIVALKRLDDAIKDGDKIHAVLKGSAISNDGKAKLGYTAPGKTGQKKAIEMALKKSGVDPKDIGLLEAHGTGTPLGDPIEVQAISEVYSTFDVPNQNCAIGSVKGNVGHLDTAAGVASLIKSILSVRDGLILPSLHCRPENPRIQFDTTPFYLAHDCSVWPNRFQSRIAAVSSFGIGGTNCHMIVEQPPKQEPVASDTSSDEFEILAVSNHKESNVLEQANQFVSSLENDQLSSQCKTAALKRTHYPSRVALYGKSKKDFRKALKNATVQTVKTNPTVAWVFSGQGSQKPGMGKAFYEKYAVFRDAIDDCDRLFSDAGIANLKEVMFDDRLAEKLNQTLYTQPALFAWQYAMGLLLIDWEVEPDFVAGHSIGEFAACVMAEHFSVESVVRLVAHRARLMQEQTDEGRMLAIKLPEAQLQDVLSAHEAISIASINSADRFTLSGRDSDVSRLIESLDASQIAYKELDVHRAFHSSTMEAIRDDFLQFTLQQEATAEEESDVCMYSTLTGGEVQFGDLTLDYWFQQLRSPVLFHPALESIAKEEPDLVVEISPDGSFLSLLKHSDVFDSECVVGKVGYEHSHELVAQLFSLGYEQPLEAYYENAAVPFSEMPPLVFSDTHCWASTPIHYPAARQHSGYGIQEKEPVQSMEFWGWQWQPITNDVAPKSEFDDELKLRWAIIGNNKWADSLNVEISALGHQCDIYDTVQSVQECDRIVDTRSLTLDWALEASVQTLTAAREQLVQLGQYIEQHPKCRIITLLSSSAQKVSAGNSPHSDNLLWPFQNLNRSLANEKPQLALHCLDIHDCTVDSTLVSILSNLDEPSPILSLKNNQLYTLDVVSKEVGTPQQTMEWRSEHFTVIAGLGAVGLGLAEWLVEKGCDKLVIIVRQALNEQQKALIQSLKSQEVTVHVLQASLVEEHALSAAFDTLDVTVDRVFHTAHAGTHKLHPLDDGSAFEGSLPVKLIGSMNLHRVFENQPLELFCMFTSLSSMMAISGTSGYATANAWQDSYAAYLRQHGVPALTVSWSQLQLSRDAQYVASVNDTGMVALSKEQTFSVMEQLIQNNESGLTPILYDANVLGQVVSKLPATSVYLKDIFTIESTDAAAPAATDGNNLISLDNLSTEEAKKTVAEFLHQLICQRLQYSSDQLDPDGSLTGQGVDSLIFLDIVQVINKTFSMDLPPTAGYEHGTITALSQYIASQLKKDDIEFSQSTTSGAESTIVADPAAAYEPFPLTDLQQAFWLGRRNDLNLGSVSCHEYLELQFDELDIDKLETAWNRLIARHDMMRCVITGDGLQRILPHSDQTHYQVGVTDLSNASVEERESHLANTRQRMSYQVFNPQTWPLFELSVSKWDGGIRVHLDMDLLVFDIQSLRVIFGELDTLLLNPDTEFQPLTLSFRDYIMVEKAREAEPRWLSAKEYWQNKLNDIPPAPELPMIREESTSEQMSFRTLDHVLERDTWEVFKQRARDFGITPSGAMLAAYTYAIASYAKSSEFTLNITYFNRKNVHPQVMDICGDFTSLMLLPVSVDATETFIDAAKRTQESLWKALEHRDYNGIRVMRDLGRHMGEGADAIQMPVVFTSMIGMDFNDPSQPGWELQRHQIFEVNQTPQVWLDYQARESNGALFTQWFIADEFFEKSMIEGLFETYTSILDKLAKEEEFWTAQFPDLRSDQAKAISSSLNRVVDTQLPTLMPEPFHKSAGQMAQRAALLTHDSSLSYQEVQARVNQLANHLIHIGLSASEPVAVVMPKSVEAVITALAIQTAGGCYTPINADFDNQRLEQILIDLEPFAILTVADIELSVPCSVINVQRLNLTDESTEKPIARQTSNQLSYIIYTSGSTGGPKGVMLDHEAPLNTLQQLANILDLGPDDRTLSMCAFHHDMSVFDLFAMFGSGGAVVLPERDRAYDAMHWLSLMHEHKPSILNAVPAFITMLLDAIEQQDAVPPSPRHIMMGGDWIPVELVRRIQKVWPEVDIHSIGGPTETAIVSTHYRIQNIEEDSSRIPYGRPLPNQTCVLLNSAGIECPPNVVGEICMGGMARSLGYLKDAERTAEKYRPHPLTGEPLFYTGDMGVLRPDGQLDILGRIDNQIKINGLRVEPGEIEAAIEQHPQVSEAVVVYAGEPTRQLHGFVKSIEVTSTVTDEDWYTASDDGHNAIEHLPENFDLADYAEYYSDMEQLATWVMLRTIQAVGFFKTEGDTASFVTLVDALKVSPHYQKLFESWVRVLTEDGYLVLEKDEYKATHRIKDAEEYDRQFAKIVAHTETGPEHTQRIWSLISRCIERSGALLDGSFNPLELMFEDGKTDFAESWYRENPVSTHFNRVAGKVAGGFLSNRSGPLRILEFGAGIGSVTHEILANMPSSDFSYDFTDLSTYFLDNAADVFKAYPQLNYGLYNINEEPSLQGYQYGEYDLVIGANVLHDAEDLNAASRRLRALLKPDGALLLVEGTNNPRFQLVSLGFVEGLTHYADERLETCLPMISAPSWQQVMNRAGFAKATCFPKAGHDTEVMNYHVLLGQNSGSDCSLDIQSIQSLLKNQLPAHMQPAHWHHLLELPLTLNGKVDRQKLATEIQSSSHNESLESGGLALTTEQEHLLASAWSDTLNIPVETADANFFMLGGDSLLLTRLSGLLQDKHGIYLDLATLVKTPRLCDQAVLMGDLPVELDNEEEAFEEGVI
ncbi:hypothetical protein CW749_20140 [Vibrio sp. vnigr-6D03]|uniref:hybrid non-ribosomal peptide synthetase/type I polyketide synthase n=1 Tax=Vibrio sp. vnigr-6D03 TaxID=2058088 RepID=UPI000C330DE3|nr:hybrid non-ribosomal peptide synthetase/type I polyketide synthase [Vibrio sp. vnigr-6D03]PKF77851.1 hypothetical protein CW749_20140 [Vibrio sp. vnigr-6D03]